MMFFNAFQATAMFAGAPFAISWLAKQEFPYQTAAVFAAVIIYGIGFMGMVDAVHKSMKS